MDFNLEAYESEDVIEFCPELGNEAPQDSATKIVYVCSLCLRQYTLLEDLRGHMIEYHKYRPIKDSSVSSTLPDQIPAKEEAIVKPFVAPPNVETTKHTVENVESMALQPAAPATEMRPMPFKDFRVVLRSSMTIRCSVTYCCPYKFENASKLALHAKCHVDAVKAQQFACFICSAGFESWRRCSAHLWKAHEVDIDLLHCPQCEYRAHVSALVWRHMRVHKKWRSRVLRSLRAVQQRRTAQNVQKADGGCTPNAPVNKNKYYAEKTCEICGRKFVNGKTLSKHVKAVHNKIKPFICNVCGKKTARKASLIIHMRQHTGEKPLQCKTCKFATRDPSVLHKHQQRHEKVGKFKCELCDYASIQTNAYKRHMRLNHPEEYKKIACDLCTYVTISAERLRVHKDDHRKGLVINREDSMDATSKNPRKLHDKNNEISADCFLPLESIDSLPHEPAVDTGGVTIPAPSEDTQFPTYLNN